MRALEAGKRRQDLANAVVGVLGLYQSLFRSVPTRPQSKHLCLFSLGQSLTHVNLGITSLWTEVSNSAPSDDGMKRSRGEIQPTPSTHVTPEGKKGHVEADVAPRKLFEDDTYTGGNLKHVCVSQIHHYAKLQFIIQDLFHSDYSMQCLSTTNRSRNLHRNPPLGMIWQPLTCKCFLFVHHHLK